MRSSKFQVALLVILFSILSALSCYSADIKVPEYLGIFGFSGGALHELEYLEMNKDSTVTKWNSVTLDNTNDTKIIVYGDYSPSSISLYRVSSSVVDRKLRVEENIQIRIKPQSGLQGLIGSLLVVEPRKPFVDGHYVAYIAGKGESFVFTIGKPAPFFSLEPVYSIAECGNRVFAGCVSGLMVFENDKAEFLALDKSPLLTSVKNLAELKLDKIRFIDSAKTGDPRGGEYVWALSSTVGNFFYLFDTKTAKRGVSLQLATIRNGWIDANIVRYYDILFPTLNPYLMWFGSSGCNKDDGYLENYGMISIPKEKGLVTITVNNAPKSEYDTIEKEKRVFCFSEASSNVILIGTDKCVFRTEYITDKSKFDHRKLDKIAESPKNVIYMSPGVGNRVYAISGDGGVFITADTGKTWSSCADIQKAERILISQKNPKYVMFISEGKLSISNDDGKTFKALSVNDSPVYAMCFSDRDENLIYAGTAKGAYKSTDLGATWNGMTILP